MGPLAGVRVLEIGGIGPGPFAAMILADLGADVVRIDRPDAVDATNRDLEWLVLRGKRSISVDLKSEPGRQVALGLAESADVLIEGFRPGVAERLGVGPDEVLRLNSGIVYARATGWGQNGPWAQVPGHDINYVAVTGVLHATGRRDSPPAPPLNVVGDYSGGGLVCVAGILAALLERERSGHGQVIDAAMVDGVALLSTLFYGMSHLGKFSDEREANNIDGGAPWYDTYSCADGRYVAVGAGEPRFFAALCDALGLGGRFEDPMDRSRWDEMRHAFGEAFARQTRDEWTSLIGDLSLCLAPVLTWSEAPNNPHLQARETYVVVDEILQPGPAPRFSRTSPDAPTSPPWPGEHTDEVIESWGVKAELVDAATQAGALRQRSQV